MASLAGANHPGVRKFATEGDAGYMMVRGHLEQVAKFVWWEQESLALGKKLPAAICHEFEYINLPAPV